MNAPVTRPPQGWVTVAAAADALTRSGDQIDASNVSRYLARWPEVPSVRIGKFRYVDPAVLKRHREQNVQVGDKRASRDVEPAQIPHARPQLGADLPIFRASAARADDQAEDLADDDQAPAARSTPIADANLRLKELQVRERELDMAEREGQLVPAAEVLALVGGVVQVLVAELEREEVRIAAEFGREVAAATRKARKAAQAKAAQRLHDLARAHLPPALAAAAAVAGVAPGPEAAAA